MDLLTHALPQGCVDNLMPPHPAQTCKRRTDDQCFKMLPISSDLKLLAFKATGNILANLLRTDHFNHLPFKT